MFALLSPFFIPTSPVHSLWYSIVVTVSVSFSLSFISIIPFNPSSLPPSLHLDIMFGAYDPDVATPRNNALYSYGPCFSLPSGLYSKGGGYLSNDLSLNVGDDISLEIDLRAPINKRAERTLHFFINGQLHPSYFRNLPAKIKFAV